MTTAIYRKNSGEVIKISLKDQLFTEADPQFWGILTDSGSNINLPDGNKVRDDSGDFLGPLRVAGFAKIAISESNTIQNATQDEIDGFPNFQTDDENQQSANVAADLGDTHPQFRKVFKSILKGIVRENNIQANKYNELRAEILAAANFNDLKTRIQNNTSDMPIRTNTQAFSAIRNDVNKDD